MAKTPKSCLQLLLKTVNSMIGIVGIAMVMYSVWMVRVWERDLQASPSNYYLPWFIHAFLGIGITLCGITCLGHIAANTANTCCLIFYMVTISVLLLVETGFIADIFLNSDWIKDLPEDRTGKLDDFTDFFESNFDTCKWIVLLIILAQGCSVLLANVLRSLMTDKYISNYIYNSSDTDEENAAPRLTLLDHPEHPLHSAVVDFTFPNKR